MIPPSFNWMRISALLLGIAILIWLPFEDSDIKILLAFALAICLWGGLRLLNAGMLGKPRTLGYSAVIGFATGLAVVPAALILMAVKTGLHAHRIPEYTPEQVQHILVLTPILSIGGFLLVLGAGLLGTARRGQ